MMDEKSNRKDEIVAEIKQEPESLDMTPLASIKSILRQALGYDDLTPIDLTKHISVALRSSSGQNAIAEREAGSDILRFFASGDYPATSLKVSIVPVQEGTGTPSSENIRPITGWTAVKVYHAAEYDEEAEPVIEVALGEDAGTVYGGTLDAVTGVLTVTHGFRQFTGDESETWYYLANAETFYLYNNSMGQVTDAEGICNMFSRKTTWSAPGVRFGVANTIVYFMGLATVVDSTDPADLKLWLSENPLQIAFPLATPLTFELDPEELSTLIGENNIWADCGPVESITY